MTERVDFDAIIIGAGFSGLYQLYKLRDEIGLSVQIFEAADNVGGTWYWNRYPGARCDSESHTYCYYFSEKLLKKWEWSERYPGQAEILEYLNFVTDTLRLRNNISFNSRITKSEFLESEKIWLITDNSGKQYRSKYVINAVGCLSTANKPDIPGIKKFNGKIYHTGEWPHEEISFSNKRVGVIGTGSSGIQAIPVISETARLLTVFQRTPNYSVPARNQKLSTEFIVDFKNKTQDWLEKMLLSRGGHAWPLPLKHAFDTPEQERLEIMNNAWQNGGLGFRECFDDILTNTTSNNIMSEFLKDKIRSIVKNPDKARALSDIDHPFSTKRPPIDTNYFETYNKPNVSLVDIRKDPIKEIFTNGLRTFSDEFELDIIVFATGFDAMTGSILKMDIKGRDNSSIKNIWSAGPKTYLGLQVAGFPNMFFLTGPGSPSVLTNMPRAIEQHVDWVTDCISHMESNNLTSVEATPEAVESWVDHVNDTANKTLLPKAKHSWYLGANVPGKPRVFMPYTGGLNNYRDICNKIAKDGYAGFLFS